MKIVLKNITKSFQDAEKDLTVISDVSFEFPVGKTIAIVGESGVGKSTLLNLLGGLEKVTSGSVMLGSTCLERLSEEQLAAFRGKNIGFIFQFHHLLPEFSALENVAMPLLIAGESEELAYEKAYRILDRIGLSERKNHRPSQMSGGEQQRVSVARAVIANPPLLLADEPTGNLDSGSAHAVKELMLELHKECRATLVVVTHSMELAAGMDVCLEMQPGGALEIYESSKAR